MHRNPLLLSAVCAANGQDTRKPVLQEPESSAYRSMVQHERWHRRTNWQPIWPWRRSWLPAERPQPCCSTAGSTHCHSRSGRKQSLNPMVEETIFLNQSTVDMKWTIVRSMLACVAGCACFFSCAMPEAGGQPKAIGQRRSPCQWKTWFDYVKNCMPENQRQIGPYKNLYQGSPHLAGIEVYQLPVVDNAVDDYSGYLGRSPGVVNYHFWDGRILEVRQSPAGKILAKSWYKHRSDEEPEYYQTWEMVDFQKGSDPGFRHHSDPRRPPGHGLYP